MARKDRLGNGVTSLQGAFMGTKTKEMSLKLYVKNAKFFQAELIK